VLYCIVIKFCFCFLFLSLADEIKLLVEFDWAVDYGFGWFVSPKCLLCGGLVGLG